MRTNRKIKNKKRQRIFSDDLFKNMQRVIQNILGNMFFLLFRKLEIFYLQHKIEELVLNALSTNMRENLYAQDTLNLSFLDRLNIIESNMGINRRLYVENIVDQDILHNALIIADD